MTTLLQKIMKTPVVTEGREKAAENKAHVLLQDIDALARRHFGRSLHIRQVDAGSCNGCELEISALNSPYYDLEQYGLHFVASPRHADCLLVTGPVTRNMADPLKRTYDATPEPKIVVAVGDCAHDCGIFKGAYAVAGAVADFVPVDVVVQGCPPTPRAILEGILAALEKQQK